MFHSYGPQIVHYKWTVLNFAFFDVHPVNFCVSATQLHKYVNVEVDPNQKSERPEWSTARYHALYSPQCGFELQVQWMVSTGGILGELVSSKWSTARYHALYSPQCRFELQNSVDGFYRWNIRGVGK